AGTANFIGPLLGATSTHVFFTQSVAVAGVDHNNGVGETDGTTVTKLNTEGDVRYLGQTDQYIYFGGGTNTTAQVYRVNSSDAFPAHVSGFSGQARYGADSSARAGNTVYFRAGDPNVNSPFYDPNQECVYKMADTDASILQLFCTSNASSALPNHLTLYRL